MNTLGGGELWFGKNNLDDPVSFFKCYLNELRIGVADENRTRNPQSGNLMLHHLSYSDA